MSSPNPPLPLWEKATLVAAFIRALGAGVYNLVLAPFRGNSGAPTIVDHVKLAFIRSLLANATSAQHQFITPPLNQIYQKTAKERGFTPESLTLEDGTKAYWIGKSSSEKVIIWYHGGGYNLPASVGHLNFMADINDATGPDVAVLFLGYDLAPQAQYPRQMTQGVEILHHVINNLQRKPSSIMIAGDSAGANLALGVLSHLSHPHPSIPPLRLPSPLLATILLAPWTSFSNDWPSVTRNAQKDTVELSASITWRQNFLGKAERDRYNEPMTAESGWWEGLKAEEVLIVGASDEVLVDSIRAFTGNLKAAHPKTDLVIVPGEFHDKPIMNGIIGGANLQAEVIVSWIQARV